LIQVLLWLIVNVALSLKEWEVITSWQEWTIFIIVGVPILLTILAVFFSQRPKVTFIFISTTILLSLYFIKATVLLVKPLSFLFLNVIKIC
jgi:hypothetical protein